MFPFEKAKNNPEESRELVSEDGQTSYHCGLILLVDDEETILSVGKTMLERLGHDVVTASNGFEAVRAVREHADSLVCVLLDLTMPKMDGLETHSEIKRIRSDLPVIICSGYSLQDASIQFASKGLNDFLQKPYRFKQLSKKLEELLG